LGSYTEQALDGTTTIYHVFESPGPLYNKVRSIQKASNGTFTTVYQAAYDETGRIIRQVDEKGHVTSFGYDANGNQIVEHVELSHDPALLASLAAEEKVLVEKVKQSNASYYPLQDLFEFYIGNLQFDKAAGLLPLATIREQVYDMKLDVVVTNPNLSLADKTQKLALLIKEFPDKKVVTENFMTNQENK
jgi:YD repeat-containing protein